MAQINCECFIVMPPLTQSAALIVGRNSLHDALVSEEVVHFPGGENCDEERQCDGRAVPEGSRLLSTIISRRASIWGAESGSNEAGVYIAVTFAQNEVKPHHLKATDFARLVLERCVSAQDAVSSLTKLVTKHGDVECSLDAAKMCFLICDAKSACILNFVGSMWAAEYLKTGFICIPHGFAITTKIDEFSENLELNAKALGLWDGEDTFNFRSCFSPTALPLKWPTNEPSSDGCFTVADMFEVLRAAANAATSNVQSSQVSALRTTADANSSHWFTATPDPNESVFKPFVFTPGARISPLTQVPKAVTSDEGHSCETLLYTMHKQRKWAVVGELLQSLEASCVNEMQGFLNELKSPNQELDEIMKDCVEAEVKFYR